MRLYAMAVIDRFCTFYRDLSDLAPDQLSDLYADDILFIDPITTHTGIDAVKAYFARLTEHAQSCHFDIGSVAPCIKDEQSDTFTVTWTMRLVISNHKAPILLEGITVLRICNDRITYHRDYYDLGEMVYEHLPVIGWVIRKIKQRLAS